VSRESGSRVARERQVQRPGAEEGHEGVGAPSRLVDDGEAGVLVGRERDPPDLAEQRIVRAQSVCPRFDVARGRFALAQNRELLVVDRDEDLTLPMSSGDCRETVLRAMAEYSS
jgi:hypothetical protein